MMVKTNKGEMYSLHVKLYHYVKAEQLIFSSIKNYCIVEEELR